MSNRVSGVILAGGLGSRMLAESKPLVDFRGKPLIQWVIVALRPQVDTLWLSVHGAPGRLADLGLPLIPDLSTSRIGPLSGVLAAMNALPNDDLLFAPCDVPFLPADLRSRLQLFPAAYAETANGPEPCVCWLKAPQSTLVIERRSLLRWHQAIGSVAVAFADAAAFTNFNTPAELQCSVP